MNMGFNNMNDPFKPFEQAALFAVFSSLLRPSVGGHKASLAFLRKLLKFKQ